MINLEIDMLKSAILGVFFLLVSSSTVSASGSFCSENLSMAKVVVNKLLSGMSSAIIEKNIQRIMFESGCKYEISKNFQGHSVTTVRKRSHTLKAFTAKINSKNKSI
jgi:hypothetical protein